jgi:hypothetical protein
LSTFVIGIKLHKENDHPLGENSPNLVTLARRRDLHDLRAIEEIGAVGRQIESHQGKERWH